MDDLVETLNSRSKILAKKIKKFYNYYTGKKMKEKFYYILKATTIFVHQIGKTGWKETLSSKENVFCQDQVRSAEKITPPKQNFIVYRFHNWYCAVDKKDIIERMM